MEKRNYHNFFNKQQKYDSILLLEDGTEIYGYGFGSHATKIGEMCFNTAMTGYQEIITDPSYAGQIINFTFPHIGNVGTNINDIESKKPSVNGIIVRNKITNPSNWRSTSHLNDWLIENNLPGVYGIDTRLLTQIIRNKGAQKGLISYSEDGNFNLNHLKKKLNAWPNMSGLDLTCEVSVKKKYNWSKPLYKLEKPLTYVKKHIKIVAIDYGCKENILRCLAENGCDIIVLPSDVSASEILNLKPDGIFLANGPGDPSATAKYALDVIKPLIQSDIPIFGICIGHQLLSIAFGCKTKKMEIGHRGVNHPVKNLETGKIEITSQNHGFVVDRETISNELKITHLSLFDNSIEGLKHTTKPIFSVQYHPESSPGPHDSRYLFEDFINLIVKNKNFVNA